MELLLGFAIALAIGITGVGQDQTGPGDVPVHGVA